MRQRDCRRLLMVRPSPEVTRPRRARRAAAGSRSSVASWVRPHRTPRQSPSSPAGAVAFASGAGPAAFAAGAGAAPPDGAAAAGMALAGPVPVTVPVVASSVRGASVILTAVTYMPFRRSNTVESTKRFRSRVQPGLMVGAHDGCEYCQKSQSDGEKCSGARDRLPARPPSRSRSGPLQEARTCGFQAASRRPRGRSS